MSKRSIVISHRGAPELLSWLRSALDASGALREGLFGSDLETALRDPAPPDLVIASTELSDSSAIAALVTARAAGIAVPFIIVAGFKDDRVRCFVSAAGPRGFEHRVLSRDELAKVVAELVSAPPPIAPVAEE